MSRKLADYYTKQACKLGFPARSVWKLNEIQEKFQLFKKGQTVIDLGCFPGSWLMLMSREVGRNGRVVGIDKVPVSSEILSACSDLSKIRVLERDLLQWDPPEPFLRRFDVVASDMAPSTIGNKELDTGASYELSSTALGLSPKLLVPSGAVVIKIFQGPMFEQFQEDMGKLFSDVRCFKPKSCRKESKEVYVIGRGLKE